MTCQLFCSAAAADALYTITTLTHTRKKHGEKQPLV